MSVASWFHCVWRSFSDAFNLSLSRARSYIPATTCCCTVRRHLRTPVRHARHARRAPSFADARVTCTACTPWRSLPSPRRGHDATTCSLRCCPRFYTCYKTCSDKQLVNAPNRHGYNLNCHGYMRMLQQSPP